MLMTCLQNIATFLDTYVQEDGPTDLYKKVQDSKNELLTYFGKGRYTHASHCLETVFGEVKEAEPSVAIKIETILHTETLLQTYQKEAHRLKKELIIHEPHWDTLGLDKIYAKLRFPDPIAGILKTKALIGWKKKDAEIGTIEFDEEGLQIKWKGMAQEVYPYDFIAIAEIGKKEAQNKVSYYSYVIEKNGKTDDKLIAIKWCSHDGTAGSLADATSLANGILANQLHVELYPAVEQ